MMKMAIGFTRKNDSLEARIFRMGEFYSDEELDIFMEALDDREYPVAEAWEFLDTQTRVDYWASKGAAKPDINQYIKSMEYYFGN